MKRTIIDNDEISAPNHKNSDEKVTKVRNLADLQRLKLEKLMKNPEKPVIIPEKPKSKNVPPVPDFVRNVMGSSAGAGSGEFHVYRHLRRKEYARQKFIQEMSKREKLEFEYQETLEHNRKLAEEKTAKKRAKRLKKKAKMKNKKRKPNNKQEQKVEKSESESESDSENENKSSDEKTIEESSKPLDDIQKSIDENDTSSKEPLIESNNEEIEEKLSNSEFAPSSKLSEKIKNENKKTDSTTIDVKNTENISSGGNVSKVLTTEEIEEPTAAVSATEEIEKAPEAVSTIEEIEKSSETVSTTEAENKAGLQ